MNSRRLAAAIALLACACSTSNEVTVGASAEPAGSTTPKLQAVFTQQANGSTKPAGSANAPKESSPVAKDGPDWLGIPRDAAEVLSVVNKSGREPYAGKVGTLKGRVTMKGDPSPTTDFKYPTKDCHEAAGTYGKVFRVGQDNALADALVAVVGYDAFVPPEKPAVTVKAQGCAFEKRTVAMMFGQRLEVTNGDPKTSYMPFLDGAEYRAVMMSVPGGDPVKLYPFKPAINYVLRDYQGRNFMQADVLVLKFPTAAVTGLDGKYEIGRIPVGEVTVNAYLPALDKTVEKKITIKEGDNDLDLELTYDKAADKIAERRPDPWSRGTDPNKEAAAPGKYGAPPKLIPKDVPR